MRTVLYISDSNKTACAQIKSAGADHRLARNGVSLRKVEVDNITASDLKQLVSFWNARGIIVDCGGQRPCFHGKLPRSVPVVYLDVAREFESKGRFTVSYDIRATCHLAAKELLSLNCAKYAYAGYGKTTPWSEERKRIFAQALKLNGHEIETFDLDPAKAKPSAFYKKLTAWVQRTKKPVGVFAADDAYAVHVHSVVQNLKLRIPSEVAILGVDNDAAILTTPGISSIQLDFQAAGQFAAELLLERIARPGLAPCNRHFGPVQLLRRSSTRKLKYGKLGLEHVLRRIRERALDGLTAKEVASWMPGSRRLSELTFRRETGHSILEEITATRIARAKELLSDTHLTIGEIATLCGYRTFNAFRNAFKSATGLTPSAARK